MYGDARLRFFSEWRSAEFAVPEIVDAIQAAERDLARQGRLLRPDAKHFLLINLHQLVALPLVMNDQLADLRSVLSEDVSTIAARAAGTTGQRSLGEFDDDDVEISAHRLLDTIARSWESLNLSQIRLWHRYDASA